MLDSNQNNTSFGIFNFTFLGVHIINNLATLKKETTWKQLDLVLFFFKNKFPNYTVHYQKKFPPLKIGIEHIGEMWSTRNATY